MTIPYSLIPIGVLLGFYLAIVGLIGFRLVSRRAANGPAVDRPQSTEIDTARSWTANTRFSFQLDSPSGKSSGQTTNS